MRDVVCIGLLTLDIVGRPITVIPQGEGTTLIEGIEVVPAATAGAPAMITTKFGLSAGLASAIGDDRKGKVLKVLLEDMGVGVDLLRVLPGLPSSSTILTVAEDGGRPNFHALGAAMMLELDEAITEPACSARFVHWGGVGAPKLDGGPGAKLLAEAKKAGATVTCDLISPFPAARDEIARLLPHVDWFLPSAVEARMLAETDDLEAAARRFHDLGAKGCVIKDGSAGAILSLPGQAPKRIPAFPIKAADTTCCGDTFCGGFITALSQGRPPERAVAFAAATAAFVPQGLGTMGILEKQPDALAAVSALADTAAL